MSNLLETVKQKATALNIEFTESTNQYDRPLIGFRGKGVYHWYQFCEINGASWLIFDHTYSQNTGSVKKGLTHRMHVTASLEKRLGIDFINETIAKY